MFSQETIDRYLARVHRHVRRRTRSTVRACVGAPLRSRTAPCARTSGRQIVKENPRCCSSASTTPAAARWPPGSLDHSARRARSRPFRRQRPGRRINPAVVEAMAEIGVDMSEEYPEAAHRRGRTRSGRRDHHGLRRRLPDLPRQALRGLDARRSRRAGRRHRSPHPRRDRPACAATRQRATRLIERRPRRIRRCQR